MPGLGYLLKFFVFERYYLKCLHLTLTLRTAKKLCSNLQEPPWPLKFPGYAPVPNDDTGKILPFIDMILLFTMFCLSLSVKNRAKKRIVLFFRCISLIFLY